MRVCVSVSCSEGLCVHLCVYGNYVHGLTFFWVIVEEQSFPFSLTLVAWRVAQIAHTGDIRRQGSWSDTQGLPEPCTRGERERIKIWNEGKERGREGGRGGGQRK